MQAARAPLLQGTVSDDAPRPHGLRSSCSGSSGELESTVAQATVLEVTSPSRPDPRRTTNQPRPKKMCQCQCPISRLIAGACAGAALVAQAVTNVLTLWRAVVRNKVVFAAISIVMVSFFVSVLVCMWLDDIPIVDGLADGQLLAVVGAVAIILTLLGDMFPVMLAVQSHAHAHGGLEHDRPRRAEYKTSRTLNACAFLAVALPIVRTVYNVDVLGSFLAGRRAMSTPHTRFQEYRAASQVVVAFFMALSVPTYQLGFVSRCITAHNEIRAAADKWKRRLATAASHPEGQMNPKPFVEDFDAAAATVDALNSEYAKTMCAVILVRTSFILVYTTLQLMMGSTTSSWVYVIVPALELLNLLGAAATVTQQHHLLMKWAHTAAFDGDADGDADGDRNGTQPRAEGNEAPATGHGSGTGANFCATEEASSESKLDAGQFEASASGSPAHAPAATGCPVGGAAQDALHRAPRAIGRAAPQYMACADRLAKHVTAHRSRLSVRVYSPLGRFSVTRSYVLRLTVGIGTSLLTLLLKDIIEANLHLAGIQFSQSNFTIAIPIIQ